jgi:hypothetical protein
MREPDTGALLRMTYAFMVVLPSLLNIRRSELVEAFLPTTKGFFVVPSMYCAALHGVEHARSRSGYHDSHVIVEGIRSIIEGYDDIPGCIVRR